MPEVLAVDPSQVRDIAPEVLGADGRLKVLPAEYWATTTPIERGVFGVRNGLYSFPTTELVEYLGNLIDGRPAIEIAAGHGVLAAALGIPGTDNYQQLAPGVRDFYEKTGQAIAPYGPNVERLDDQEAIKVHRPRVVIGCWVTHRYDPARHAAGGSETGPDERQIIDQVETYVTVGNQKVHAGKAVWARPHVIVRPSWVSRAWNGTPDFVAHWDRP